MRPTFCQKVKENLRGQKPMGPNTYREIAMNHLLFMHVGQGAGQLLGIVMYIALTVRSSGIASQGAGQLASLSPEMGKGERDYCE